MKKICLWFLFLSFFTVHSVFAGEGKFHGVVFGDYYYVADHHKNTNTIGFDVDGDGTVETAEKGSDKLKGRNGFQFRRIYFGYDRSFSENVSSRLRLEMVSTSFHKVRNSGEDGKMTPVVKDAYLKWKVKKQNVVFGLSGTPTWGGVVEKFWGYRSVEKTIADLQKLGSSRDFGLGVNGAFDDAKKWGYRVMVGHGNSNGDEFNRDKKAYLSFYGKPLDGLVVEIYGDYEPNSGGKKGTSRVTLQGFIGFEGSMGRVALQYVNQDRGDNVADISGFSVFGAFNVNKKLTALARVDLMQDPNSSGSKIDYFPMVNDEESTLFILGLDYSPVKNVHFIPNAEFVTYSNDNNTNYNDDLHVRFTVSYKWK
ncbi:MAG: hypothetical protein ACE5FU_08940 [Nitrospinota bacterium]